MPVRERFIVQGKPVPCTAKPRVLPGRISREKSDCWRAESWKKAAREGSGSASVMRVAALGITALGGALSQKVSTDIAVVVQRFRVGRSSLVGRTCGVIGTSRSQACFGLLCNKCPCVRVSVGVMYKNMPVAVLYTETAACACMRLGRTSPADTLTLGLSSKSFRQLEVCRRGGTLSVCTKKQGERYVNDVGCGMNNSCHEDPLRFAFWVRTYMDWIACLPARTL